MAKVKFTTALNSFFPDLKDIEVNGSNVHEVLSNVEMQFPGISNYLREENGELRKHVNVFVQGKLIKDRQGLSDKVNGDHKILVIQALSGG